jgi:hypothetical protein
MAGSLLDALGMPWMAARSLHECVNPSFPLDRMLQI